MINAGVDIMGRGTLLVGATHQEKDIDQTVGAFEQALTSRSRTDRPPPIFRGPGFWSIEWWFGTAPVSD
jgi:hypothetical protein